MAKRLALIVGATMLLLVSVLQGCEKAPPAVPFRFYNDTAQVVRLGVALGPPRKRDKTVKIEPNKTLATSSNAFRDISVPNRLGVYALNFDVMDDRGRVLGCLMVAYRFPWWVRPPVEARISEAVRGDCPFEPVVPFLTPETSPSQ
jgi:hypothetical protein